MGKQKPEIRIASVSGQGTNIALPRLKLGFDIGVCPDHAVSLDTIMITHGHADHVGSIGIHAARRSLVGADAPTYITHPRLTEDLHTVLGAFERMNRGSLPYKIVELEPGTLVRLPKKNGSLLVEPFPSYHRIPCQGYTLWSSKRKLHSDYVGLTGDEYRELREQGVDVTHEVTTPEYAYTGDATIKVVDAVEIVRRVKTLFIEVTFLDDKMNVEKARARGHIHLDEIIERADIFQNERIYLMHFSARYSPGQVKKILSDRLPKNLAEKVRVLL
jgi:ribonuclease Z